ncbi:MAG TPA: hypothetical protein VG675_14885 [Bryobacteraceae bacterium]|nr:hypothetical protein [Bryobacteraceae bacterium]
MRALKLVLPMAILAAGFLSVAATYAKPEYAKKEKRSCKFCHYDSKPGSSDLTAAGKYYRDHGHSLQGYREDGDKNKS